MTEAFGATGFLMLMLTLVFGLGFGMGVDAESRVLKVVASLMAALTGMATIACFLCAIWWEVLP